MFKKTKPTQIDLFKDISTHYSARKQKLLNDTTGWHNVFYQQVYCNIDEDIFKPLYCLDNGRSNASVKVLVAMIILKEGFGWSDKQLFEQCSFNILVMAALGLRNADQDIPVESTYYKFRSAFLAYKEEHRIDLFEQCFQHITISQIEEFDVKGDKIRMDSKLISSNIARSSRLTLVLQVIQKFIKTNTLNKLVESALSVSQYSFLARLQNTKVSKICYPLNKAAEKALLIELGLTIPVLLSSYNSEQQAYDLLDRLFGDQYELISNENDIKDDDLEQGHPKENNSKESKPTVRPKAAKTILSSSLQSAHDPDATYRSKGQGRSKQQKTGFHSNICETADLEGDLKLITDVATDSANVSEATFLNKGVDNSEAMLKKAHHTTDTNHQHVNWCITDGGYDDLANRENMSADDKPEWVLAKTKGGKPAFTMNYNDENELQVCDIKTGQLLKTSRSRNGEKVVVHGSASKTYFTDQQIQQYIIRQHYNQPIEDWVKGLRANSESTIHAVFHRLGKRDKIKYRGLNKCHCYVLCRALWVNCSRITKKIAETAAILLNVLLRPFIKQHVYLQNNNNMARYSVAA